MIDYKNDLSDRYLGQHVVGSGYRPRTELGDQKQWRDTFCLDCHTTAHKPKNKMDDAVMSASPAGGYQGLHAALTRMTPEEIIKEVVKSGLRGRDVSARRGETVLEVARENDIDIPTFCHLEGLSSLGTCRLCLVEIKGIARLPASHGCHRFCAPGAV